jgi:prepilin-type N-terminal cleavage/methylation domain-containing protein
MLNYSYNRGIMIQQIQRKGFTIVELLIVIVVIGILATITAVAYRNIQDRAQISKINQDLASANKLILVHKGLKGYYPNGNSSWRGYTTFGALGNSYIPDVIPAYGTQLGAPTKFSADSDYIYYSNGSDYKLIFHDNTSSPSSQKLCPQVKAVTPALIDPQRDCWAWGYWSPGGANW